MIVIFPLTEEEKIDSPAVTRTETESVLPPISPTHSKSKKEIRSEQESRVYNLATDKLIKNLMSEYKKKKNQNAMPTFSKPKKEKKEKKVKRKTSDPVEEIIDQQQQASIMKVCHSLLQSPLIYQIRYKVKQPFFFLPKSCNI